MKQRQLNYSSVTYDNLAKNAYHQFASGFALRIFKSNSVYSFIPKNACSTMRVSLAIANGCINDKSDFNWIHQNNGTFKAELANLIQADYTFVILRCPFARLASAYLDKIVDRTVEAWLLYDNVQRKIEIDQLHFKTFVKLISKPKILNSNIHWKPQVDFLVYKKYDDYFCLENFSAAQPEIEKKAGITIVDARSLTQHGTDRFKLINDQSYAECLPEDIRQLKLLGQLPALTALYDEETILLVRKIFKKDIDLYKKLFGTQNMLFS